MICPVCKHEIPDTSIICPLCNTQFAFSAPSSIQSSNTEVYEVVENKQVPEETFSPNERVVPTEISHGPEEEINPDAMTYYVDEAKNENEEYMHINGQPVGLSDETYNPSAVINVNPIKTEVPNNVPISNNNAPVNNNVVNPVNSLSNNNIDNLVSNNVTVANEPLQTRPPENNMVTADGVLNNQTKDNNEVNNISSVSASDNINTNPVSTSNNVSQLVGPNNVNVVNTVGVVDDKFLENKEKLRQRENIFFIVVIIFGVAILLLIAVVMMINPKKNTSKTTTSKINYTHEITPLAETKNIGSRSSFNYPMYVGNTTVASYFDQSTKQYTDVDVTGVRFFTGVEAQELASYYAKEELHEGFTWNGFEYKVQLNDLTYLNGKKVNPLLNAKFYKYNGCDFITYNEHNYLITVTSASPNLSITNGESAVVKVIYQVPVGEKDYSICLGYLDNTIGCFTTN